MRTAYRCEGDESRKSCASHLYAGASGARWRNPTMTEWDVDQQRVTLSLGGWARVQRKMLRRFLLKRGPTLPVVVALDGVQPFETLALFDTGANQSFLAPREEKYLGVRIGEWLIHFAGQPPRPVPVYKGNVRFKNGVNVDCELGIIEHLAEPHGLLIGRDILALGRLIVDFTTGAFEFHIKLP